MAREGHRGMSFCPHCNKNLELVGRSHRCIANNVNKAFVTIADVNKAAEEMKAVLSGNASWQAKWRANNSDLNRQRAREGMRKKRAQG
jgi:hypothetical protein